MGENTHGDERAFGLVKVDEKKHADSGLEAGFFTQPADIIPSVTQTDLAQEFFKQTGREVVLAPDPALPGTETDNNGIGQEPTGIIPIDGSAQTITTQTGAQETDQPELETAQGEVIDEEMLISQMEDMMASPHKYSQQEVQQVILDALAGRSYATFLRETALTNPRLVEAVQQLKEFVEKSLERNRENILRTADALGLPAPTSTESVDASEIADIKTKVVDQDGENIVLTADGRDGQERKIKITMALAVIFFVAGDLAFFRGSNMEMIGHHLGSKFGELALLKMGFDVKLPDAAVSEANTAMLGMIETPKLTQYLEDSQPHEVYTFLSQMDLQSRRDMLSGQNFGGPLHNKHKFTAEEIAMVFKKLHNDELVRLEIKDLQPQAANTQTAQPTPAPVGATSG